MMTKSYQQRNQNGEELCCSLAKELLGPNAVVLDVVPICTKVVSHFAYSF